MKSFNVIVENINKKEFVSYDVIPYLVNCYKEIKRGTKKPVNFDEFKEFIKRTVCINGGVVASTKLS